MPSADRAEGTKEHSQRQRESIVWKHLRLIDRNQQQSDQSDQAEMSNIEPPDLIDTLRHTGFNS